jgi:hypothetical protein
MIIMDDAETERLLSETKSVKDALLKKSLIPFRLTLNDAEWNHVKENVLREALTHRWERDARFHALTIRLCSGLRRPAGTDFYLIAVAYQPDEDKQLEVSGRCAYHSLRRSLIH